MYYIFQTENDFGFKCDEIHEITETDVVISNDIHQHFLDEQAQGKTFVIKNINGTTFDEIFEEVIEFVETPQEKLFRLEGELRKTDHLMVRCYECKMFNAEGNICTNCTLDELHQKRSNLRSEIENLQSE